MSDSEAAPREDGPFASMIQRLKKGGDIQCRPPFFNAVNEFIDSAVQGDLKKEVVRRIYTKYLFRDMIHEDVKARMQQRVNFPTSFEPMAQDLDRLFLKKHLETIPLWDKLVEDTKQQELANADRRAEAQTLFGIVASVASVSGANILPLLTAKRLLRQATSSVQQHPDIDSVNQIVKAQHISEEDLKTFQLGGATLLERWVYFKQLLYSVLAMLINNNALAETIFYYMQDSQWMPLCVAEKIIEETWPDDKERKARLYVARLRYLLQDTALEGKKYAIVATAKLLLDLDVFESDVAFTAKCIQDNAFNEQLPLAFYLEDVQCCAEDTTCEEKTGEAVGKEEAEFTMALWDF